MRHKSPNGFRLCKRCGELKTRDNYSTDNICRLCKGERISKVYETERDRKRAEKHRRKARKRNLISSFTNKEWADAKLYFKNECVYCGDKSYLTQDHFVPLSKGGEYSRNNIIPACHMCNSLKSDKNFFEWYPQQPFYSKTREQEILKYLNYKCGFQQIAM